MADVKMSVKTTEEKRAKLDEIAKQHGVTRPKLISYIVDSYLEWMDGKGSFAALLAEKVKILTVDDVVKFYND